MTPTPDDIPALVGACEAGDTPEAAAAKVELQVVTARRIERVLKAIALRAARAAGDTPREGKAHGT